MTEPEPERSEEKSSSTIAKPALAIDFGTFQSRIAIWTGSKVELFENSKKQKMIPCYIRFKDLVTIHGVDNQPEHDHDHDHEMLSEPSIYNLKLAIGTSDIDPDSRANKHRCFAIERWEDHPYIASLGNIPWKYTTSRNVLARFMQKLTTIAQPHVNHQITKVVLTVPVSFNRTKLARIQKSCTIAGLEVLRFIPEPTAVALLYAQRQKVVHDESNCKNSEKVVLVFNMGAGYTDVAVTIVAGGFSKIKALVGDCIGGEDMLQNLMSHLFPNSENYFSSAEPNDIKSKWLIRVATQKAMNRLSNEDYVQIDVDIGNNCRFLMQISRETFEEVNKNVFEKCENLIIQCLNDAKVDVEKLDDVVLVGGCSYIPKVRNLVSEICKKNELYKGINPLEAAVTGAALEGAIISGVENLNLSTIHVTSFGIGIRADGEYFIPIIPRYTRIPTRDKYVFCTSHDNQTEALIVVYEGDESNVEDNYLLGYFVLTGIPPEVKGVGKVSVWVDIDSSNNIQISAVAELPENKGVCVDKNVSNKVRVSDGLSKPETPVLASPAKNVNMPTVDDGYGNFMNKLRDAYGSTRDLMTHQY